MIKNYIKVASRSMYRNKSFTFINVFGLAVSMSICLVVIMMVADQMSYDRYNSKADHIYRICFDDLNEDHMFSAMATCAPMMALTLQDKYPGIKQIARLWRGS
ncbi:hypothetical protein QQ008_22370 [Fulvivirgaceae bacterium BMA10]|uniref:ABC transporter permease n=1 Tax=Splendidivirga corallicola TaxID=3051826 RepID=A0ABT8KTR8_9BACT|nr:hypothetical protein [Fulvivirgaceae bacterium BMA10]